MLDNPFTKCLRPKRIINPYTHETLVVPCGSCDACRLAKNNRNSFLCDLESISNRYTCFITLTYANRYIPRAVVLDSLERPFGRDLVDKDTGEVLCPADLNDSDLERLLRKFYLFGDVPYLRKYDLQCFLKRLRYYINEKLGSIKVRYFAVGEYGPVHFRPHYHILLFFNSKELLSLLPALVSQAWQFGRVDCQKSKGACSSYVASYVNSSCNLPRLFTSRTVAPFALHSQRLGQMFFQSERTSVYASSARDFIRKSVVINGKYTEFNLWRSYYAYYFPKCKGYSTATSCERLYSYSVYQVARRLFPCASSCLALARDVADFVLMFNSDRDYCPESWDDKEEIKLYEYFDDIKGAVSLSDEDYTLFVNRIYLQLLTSKHFLFFVCDNLTLTEKKRKLKIIEEFYSQLEYMHLVDFFESQQLFYESDLVDDSQLMEVSPDSYVVPYFYNNVFYDMNEYTSTPAFLLYSSQVFEQSEKRVKHKKLNDANKIFFD
nr:MAG: replication initiator protein [Microvirus sp.]